MAAVAIGGYHPYAEDAGIYVAGIKLASNPGLYGGSGFFIAPFLTASLFTHLNAWILSSLHLPIEYLLFTMLLLTTWLLLYGCWELAKLCFHRRHERWAAFFLVAACLSLPVAGSSLFMMDPYLTGRSFSTPLTLLALCACLQGRTARAALLLLLVALFHPLMAIYATGFVLMLWAVQHQSWLGAAALLASAAAAGLAVQYSQRAVTESPAYRAAALSRDYFYLARWQWYEIFGLIAPLILLTAYARWHSNEKTFGSIPPDALAPVSAPQHAVALATTCVLVGAASITVSLVFARPDSQSHLVAALQPIRPFLLIYCCMFLLLGGTIGRLCGSRHVRRWAVLFATVAIGLAWVQRQAYPASPHLEMPWSASTNGWTRAFLWIRANTPPDAVFALDADYIHSPGEDAQGFRAIAERASLADRSKDGGAAAVFPQLAERWSAERTATTGLDHLSDAERLRRLAPFHVDWIVLNSAAATSMPCPFQNAAVKVCRLQ
jgi:hypothetical protein